jgi:hypothetical protein
MVLPSSERINILSIITLGECISYKSILFTLSFEDSLAALSMGQHTVRIVAVGTDTNHLIRGDTHLCCTGRYSEPLHPSCIYSANIRFFIDIDEG